MPMSITKVLGFVMGIVAILFLYMWSPQEFGWFPRCPFLVITGYKCPGCGSLRAIHALLRFHFAETINLNPIMVFSIPLVIALLASRRLRFCSITGRAVLVITVAWWILRNIIF